MKKGKIGREIQKNKERKEKEKQEKREQKKYKEYYEKRKQRNKKYDERTKQIKSNLKLLLLAGLLMFGVFVGVSGSEMMEETQRLYDETKSEKLTIIYEGMEYETTIEQSKEEQEMRKGYYKHGNTLVILQEAIV